MSSAESNLRANDEVQIRNPLNIADWDDQLKQFTSATFFHTAAWASVLHSTYNYQPSYITKGNSGKIGSLFPVMEIDSWLTGRRGVSLPFTDACEPLGDSASSVSDLVEFTKSYAAEKKWKYLECRGGKFALGNAISSNSYLGHCLRLQTNEAALFKGFDSSVRQAVRKAEQHKLKIEFSQSPAGIRTFYDLFCRTRQKHGAPPQPFAFFANIQRHVLARDLGWVVLAIHGDVPVAGAVYFHYGKSVIYKYGASNQAFQHLRANNLLMWEAIHRYAQNGYEFLDFGRTDYHNEGLRRFKLSWGAEEREIEYFRYVLRKKTYVKLDDKGRGLNQRIVRHLPRFLSRLIGILLYKHIAVLTYSLDWSRLGSTA